MRTRRIKKRGGGKKKTAKDTMGMGDLFKALQSVAPRRSGRAAAKRTTYSPPQSQGARKSKIRKSKSIKVQNKTLTVDDLSDLFGQAKI